MKLEPQILYQLHGLEVGLVKILLAAAIAVALCTVAAVIQELRAGLSAAAAWLALAALGAIVLAAVLVALATPAHAETCIASWYGRESGPRTASGERFKPDGRRRADGTVDYSCAHKTRPFGQMVTVTVLSTGRSLSCRINDRGPFVKGRCIDLSHGAARALGVAGVARVSVD